MRRVCACKVRVGINQSKKRRDAHRLVVFAWINSVWILQVSKNFPDVGYRKWVETIIMSSWVENPDDMIGRIILYPSLDVKARVQCIYYFAVEGRRCERGGEGGVDDWESET